MSKEMPKRDVTGQHDEKARDRVREGEEGRQDQIEEENIETPENFPNAPGAGKRKNPPGEMGGHV